MLAPGTHVVRGENKCISRQGAKRRVRGEPKARLSRGRNRPSPTSGAAAILASRGPASLS